MCGADHPETSPGGRPGSPQDCAGPLRSVSTYLEGGQLEVMKITVDLKMIYGRALYLFISYKYLIRGFTTLFRKGDPQPELCPNDATPRG